MSDLTSKASYTTSTLVTVLGGISLNEFAAITGAVLALATFLVNWRYKHLHYKLKKDGKDADAQNPCD